MIIWIWAPVFTFFDCRLYLGAYFLLCCFSSWVYGFYFSISDDHPAQSIEVCDLEDGHAPFRFIFHYPWSV